MSSWFAKCIGYDSQKILLNCSLKINLRTESLYSCPWSINHNYTVFVNVVAELIIDLPHQIGKSNYHICARFGCNDRNFLPKLRFSNSTLEACQWKEAPLTLSTLCIIYSCGNLIYHLVYQEISSLAFVLKNCFDLRELHFYLFIFLRIMNCLFFNHMLWTYNGHLFQNRSFTEYVWSNFGYKTNDVKFYRLIIHDLLHKGYSCKST